MSATLSKRRAGLWCGLALIGSMAVYSVSVAPTVQAEVDKGPVREAFKSGGERSEIVLREISETLKRIDGRLERLETIARQRGVGNTASEKE